MNAKQAQVEGRLINDAHEYAEKRIGISAKEVFHMVQLAHARMLFKRADIDDDGFLTEREFRHDHDHVVPARRRLQITGRL